MTAIKHSGDRGRRVAIKRLTQAAARLVSKQHKCVYMGEQSKKGKQFLNTRDSGIKA